MRVDAVVHKEDLSTALQLAQDRLAHQLRRIRSNMGDDRQAFFGRRVEVGDVAHAGQRHVERARDRRGGERQHIHFGAQFLEMLLVRHTEALLFIDDHQAQVLELHIR